MVAGVIAMFSPLQFELSCDTSSSISSRRTCLILVNFWKYIVEQRVFICDSSTKYVFGGNVANFHHHFGVKRHYKE
jgi:hypothetical protein